MKLPFFATATPTHGPEATLPRCGKHSLPLSNSLQLKTSSNFDETNNIRSLEDMAYFRPSSHCFGCDEAQQNGPLKPEIPKRYLFDNSSNKLTKNFFHFPSLSYHHEKMDNNNPIYSNGSHKLSNHHMNSTNSERSNKLVSLFGAYRNSLRNYSSSMRYSKPKTLKVDVINVGQSCVDDNYNFCRLPSNDDKFYGANGKTKADSLTNSHQDSKSDLNFSVKSPDNCYNNNNNHHTFEENGMATLKANAANFFKRNHHTNKHKTNGERDKILNSNNDVDYEGNSPYSDKGQNKEFKHSPYLDDDIKETDRNCGSYLVQPETLQKSKQQNCNNSYQNNGDGIGSKFYQKPHASYYLGGGKGSSHENSEKNNTLSLNKRVVKKLTENLGHTLPKWISGSTDHENHHYKKHKNVKPNDKLLQSSDDVHEGNNGYDNHYDSRENQLDMMTSKNRNLNLSKMRWGSLGRDHMKKHGNHHSIAHSRDKYDQHHVEDMNGLLSPRLNIGHGKSDNYAKDNSSHNKEVTERIKRSGGVKLLNIVPKQGSCEPLDIRERYGAGTRQSQHNNIETKFQNGGDELAYIDHYDKELTNESFLHDKENQNSAVTTSINKVRSSSNRSPFDSSNCSNLVDYYHAKSYKDYDNTKKANDQPSYRLDEKYNKLLTATSSTSSSYKISMGDKNNKSDTGFSKKNFYVTPTFSPTQLGEKEKKEKQTTSPTNTLRARIMTAPQLSHSHRDLSRISPPKMVQPQMYHIIPRKGSLNYNTSSAWNNSSSKTSNYFETKKVNNKPVEQPDVTMLSPLRRENTLVFRSYQERENESNDLGTHIPTMEKSPRLSNKSATANTNNHNQSNFREIYVERPTTNLSVKSPISSSYYFSDTNQKRNQDLGRGISMNILTSPNTLSPFATNQYKHESNTKGRFEDGTDDISAMSEMDTRHYQNKYRTINIAPRRFTDADDRKIESTRTALSPTNKSPNGFVRNSVYSHSLDRRGSWLQEPKSTIVYLKHKNETKRYSFAPPEKNLTTLDDVRKAYMQIFPNQFTMHFLRYNCCIYIQDMDNPREIFYELEDVSDITNKSVLKLVHHNTNDKDTVVDTRNYTPDSIHSTSSFYHHSSQIDQTKTNFPSFVDSLSRTHSKATSYDTTIDSTITNTDQDMLSEKSSICSSTMNQNMLQRDGYRENSFHKYSMTSGGKETKTNSYSKTPTKLIDASYYSEPEYDCRKYKKILPTNQSPNSVNKERNNGINKFAPMYASQIVKSPYHMDRKLSNSMINSADTRYTSERPLAGQLVLSSKENIANMSTKFNKQKQILDMMEAKLKSRNLFNTPGKDDIYRTSNNDICWESSDSKMKMETMEKRLNALTAMVQNVLRGTSVDFGDELAPNNFLILKTLHDKALQLKFDFKLLKKSTRNYNYDMQDLMHQTKQRLNIVCQYVPSYAIPKISQSLANFAVCENNFDHFGTDHEGNMSDFDGQVAFLLKHIEDYRHDMAKLEKTLNDIEISIEEFKNDLEHVNYEYKKMDADSIAIALNFANRAATDLKSRYTKLERKLIIGIDCSRKLPADGMNQINFNKERQIFIKIEPEKLRNNLNRCRKMNKVILTIKDALREEITDIEEYIRNRTQKLSRSPSNQSLTSMLSNRSTYHSSKHILNGNPATSKNYVWENCNEPKFDHLSHSCMNVIDEPLNKLASLYEQQKSHIPYTFSYVNRKKSHDENIDIMSRSLDNWRSSREDIGSKIPIEASRSASNHVKEPRIKSKRLPLLTLPENPESFCDNNYNDHIDRHYQTAPSQTSELNLSRLRKKDYCEDDTFSSNYNMACGSQSYITSPSESPNNFSLRSNRTSPEVSVKTSLKGQKLLNNQNLVTNGTNLSSPVIVKSLIHMEVHRKQPYEIKVERVKMTPKMTTDHVNVDRQSINVNSVTTETEKTNGLTNGYPSSTSHIPSYRENIFDNNNLECNNGKEDHRAHHKDNNAKKSLTISEKRKRNYTLTPSNSNVCASSKLPLNLDDIYQHHSTGNDILSEKMDKKDCANDNKSVSSGRISTMSTRSDSYLNQSFNRAILVSESASRPLDENDSPNSSGIRNVLGKRDKFEKIIEDQQQDINQHLSSVRSSHSHSQSPLSLANEGIAGSNSQIPLPPVRKFIKAGQQPNTLSSIRSPIMSPVSGNLSPIKEMSPLSSQNNLLNCTNNIADTAPQNTHYNNDNYESCNNLPWKYGQEGINGALNVKENNKKQESVTAEQCVSSAERNGFHNPAQEMIAKVHDPATLRALTMSPTQATIINLKDKINRIYDHIQVPNNIESDKEQQANFHIYEKPACTIYSQDIGNDVSFNKNDNQQADILPTTTLPNKDTNLGPKAFWQNQESATLNANKQSDTKTGSTRALNVVSPPPSYNPLTEIKCGQSKSQSYVGHDLTNVSIGHNYQNGCLSKEGISYDTSSLNQLNASSHLNDKNLNNENQKLLIAPQAPPLPKLSSASSYSTQTLASAETGFPSPSKIPIRTSNNNNISNIINNKYMSSSTKTLKGDVENLNAKNNFSNVYGKVVGPRASNASNNVTKGTYWKEFANLQRQIAAEAALAKQNKKSAPKQYSGSSGKENLSTPYPEKPLTVKTVQQPYLNNLIRNSNNETTSLNSFSTKINNNLPNGNDNLNASSISSYYRPSELSDSRCSLNSSVLGLSGFGTESNYSVPIIYDEPNNNFMHDKTNNAQSDCMTKTSSLLPEENIYSTIDGSHYGLQENSVNNFSAPTHNHSNLALNNHINNDFNGDKYSEGNNSNQMYENNSKNHTINNGQKNREIIKNTHHLNGNNHFSDDSKPISVIDSVSDNDCMFVTSDESKRDLTQSDNEILDGNPRKKIVYVVDGKKDNMVTNFQSNGSSNLLGSKSNPIGDSENGVPEYHEFESNKKTKKQPQNPVKMGTLIHHKTPD